MKRVEKKTGLLIKLTRIAEWWEHKLAALVALAYATTLSTDIPLIELAPVILFYLGSLIVSAVYVSFINDFTDIEEDIAVGKTNKMADLSPRMRWVVLVACMCLGVLFAVLMWPDAWTLTFYAGTWVVFSLYSVRPVRFKERGFLGVLCDACGAHVFPSLLMVTGVFNAVGLPINYGWLVAVGIWAFAYGLRGILAHQFVDRTNDIQTNTNTFASKVEPSKFRPIAMLIMAMELLAFGIMLVYIAQPVLLVLFPLYLVLVGIRYRKFGQTLVFVIIPKDRPWQILMDDFYKIFFPMGLLVWGAITQPWAWVVLAIHALLFHKRALTALNDYVMALKSVGQRVIRSVRSVS